MRFTLKMPKVGDAVNEVIIAEIMVAVGDQVAEGQALFLVETDKTNVEVPSPYPGKVVEIAVAVGDEVATGTPVLTMEA
jgi:pyruvate/2-oxoglutarate dehydrogenase complex dihydrolipoamide acyltransferase (E2) component